MRHANAATRHEYNTYIQRYEARSYKSEVVANAWASARCSSTAALRPSPVPAAVPADEHGGLHARPAEHRVVLAPASPSPAEVGAVRESPRPTDRGTTQQLH